MKKRTLLIAQVPATLVIIAWVPGNLAKLGALLVMWALTFQRLSKQELVLFIAVCAFFTAMNAASLKQGIFVFSRPDFLGMPIYEVFMWGGYLLHLKRLLEGPAPEGHRAVVWALALLYAACFASISDANMLFMATGALLLFSVSLFHEPMDLAYAGYLILLGALVEYTGVHSNEWHYPGAPVGGVPIWFITLWGGVGLFMRRLILPILERSKLHQQVPNERRA